MGLLLAALFLLSGCLGCPNMQVVNDTPYWTPQDKEALDSARHGCKRHFEEAPCLVKFKKRRDGTYWATCGRPR